MLTREFVIARTKTDHIHLLKKLNLWGSNLRDLTLLSEIPQLEVLSLPVNSISSMKYFSCLTKLKELYLRKNLISDLAELRHLEPLQSLEILVLSENPIANFSLYRDTVIRKFPKLTNFDNVPVTAQEREKLATSVAAKSKEMDFSIENRVHSESRSRAHTHNAHQGGTAASEGAYEAKNSAALSSFTMNSKIAAESFSRSRTLTSSFVEAAEPPLPPPREAHNQNSSAWQGRQQKSRVSLNADKDPRPSSSLQEIDSYAKPLNDGLDSKYRQIDTRPLSLVENSNSRTDSEPIPAKAQPVVLESVLSLMTLLNLDELTALNLKCIQRMAALKEHRL